MLRWQALFSFKWLEHTGGGGGWVGCLGREMVKEWRKGWARLLAKFFSFLSFPVPCSWVQVPHQVCGSAAPTCFYLFLQTLVSMRGLTAFPLQVCLSSLFIKEAWARPLVC